MARCNFQFGKCEKNLHLAFEVVLILCIVYECKELWSDFLRQSVPGSHQILGFLFECHGNCFLIK